MTTFYDGPAKGASLNLARTPFFLRVLRNRKTGTWDAADRLEDEPEIAEEIFAYKLIEGPFRAMIRHTGGGGLCVMATYAMIDPQPADLEMRTAQAWQTWCHANEDRHGYTAAKEAQRLRQAQP